MLESLLMQGCHGYAVDIFIWTYWTDCDPELARTLAPFNAILLIVILSSIGLIIYRRKIDSKKTWKQIVKTEPLTMKEVVKDGAKALVRMNRAIERFQKEMHSRDILPTDGK
jgi:hypothetical protein